MMTDHFIGEITLTISSVIYFTWFLPQIYLNFKRKSTDGFSLWMHGLLLLGYSADLLYGFGRDMQWQYRMVTIVGLVCLFVQHFQFARYGLKTKAAVMNFVLLSMLVVIVFSYAILNFTLLHHGKKYYDIAGLISDSCWATYMFPQIIKNFRLKSTKGLSGWFVAISIVLSFFDMTSALMLHWDWPSLLGSSITVLKKSILVFQIFYYKNKSMLK
ncbi:MAG: hypothetical protein COY58_09605 [Gammaproteobacteria bacterium CG_4_10_14_0_8_um_filter_38_16]|nr:MAG: hypothetical protein COY58_09605 [Gammaproteobacteria bacterium CG_4_10_14_0_8_um_filter_38_16]PJA03058.1 MAG: hypothetical protein COX72_07060 [Gammaproteobacteria bacterium CG_4_10_14_0_2_um_filter_38_22]PJB10212.1 MAG: hypothetical protein CO120_05855 [Gammaproteobacteria bacterium CG_4_9_14_3_um_filter_38_9]